MEEEVILPVFDEKKRGIRSMRKKEEKSTARLPLSYSSYSRFSIPQEIIDDNEGYTLGWIAFQCRGEHLQSDVDDAVERGWWPVKKSACPSLARRYFSLDSNARDDDRIIKGGQMLMKCPTDEYKAQLAYYENMNKIHKDQINRGLLSGKEEVAPGSQQQQQPAYLWQH